MPRRKQICPKRMQCEEGKEGAESTKSKSPEAKSPDSATPADIEDNNDTDMDSQSECSDVDDKQTCSENPTTESTGDAEHSPNSRSSPESKKENSEPDPSSDVGLQSPMHNSPLPPPPISKNPLAELEDFAQVAMKRTHEDSLQRKKHKSVVDSSPHKKSNSDVYRSTSYKQRYSSGSVHKDDSVKSKSSFTRDLPLSLPSNTFKDSESPISALSNFVKDPGKIMATREPYKQKSPILPPSITPQSSLAMMSSYLAYAKYYMSQTLDPSQLYGTLPTSSPHKTKSHSPNHSSTQACPTQSPNLRSSSSSSPVHLNSASGRLNDTALPSSTDQPLDLSVKAQGLDLSKKSKDKSKDYMSPPPKSSPSLVSPGSNASGLSSLKSLEQKFGLGAFSGDKSPKVPVSSAYKHPMIPAFGGNLYTSALFNTQPLNSLESYYKQQAETPTKKHSVNSGNQELQLERPFTPSSQSRSKESTTEKKFSPKPLFNEHASLKDPNKKYTNLSCSCGKDFESLYDLTVHMNKTCHPPINKKKRNHDYPKLVRGQDMWLNQGSEQTRQILRCMKCGESYKTLPELTVHMMQTKHYTNIVGSEASAMSRKGFKAPGSDSGSDSDVFKCKLCGESYDNMELLTSHMMLTGHHKRPLVVEPESPRPSSNGSVSNSDVRLKKMMKLDVDDTNIPREAYSPASSTSSSDNISEFAKIRCETCGDRIETSNFVDHVRVCIDSLKMKFKSKLREKYRRQKADDSQGVVKEEKSDDQDDKSDALSEDTSDGTPVKEGISIKRPGSAFITDDSNPESTNDNASANGLSALKAMENFIEKSFSYNKKPRYSSLSQMSHGLMPQTSNKAFHQSSLFFKPSVPRIGTSTPESPAYAGKYLPPLYVNTHSNDDKSVVNDAEGTNSQTRSDNVSSKINGTIDSSASHKELKFDNYDSKTDKVLPIEKSIKKEKDDAVSNEKQETKSRSPCNTSTKSLHDKYIQDTNPTEKDDDSKSGSALESLQGLVYGKSFGMDHPLDNLHKWIGSSNGVVNDNSSTVTNEPQSTTITGTVSIRKSTPGPEPTEVPMEPTISVSVPSSSGASGPRPNSPSSPDAEHEVPAQESSSEHGPGTPESGCKSPKDSDQEGNVTITCKECKRTFSSKGSYRYHLSKCHWGHLGALSSTYGGKESGPTAASPYVYLPLDHSAKFNKYYEMANELANKTK